LSLGDWLVASESPDVTQLLLDASNGRTDAAAELLPLVYDELKSIARRRMREERADHTLSATALVHEAYIRLVDQTRVTFHSRAQFLAAAARAMRQILVDAARQRDALKRGGGWERVDIEPSFVRTNTLDMIALDEALQQLAAADPRGAKVVELRAFGGMTIEQAAAVLGVGHATIERDWAAARAWLLSRLGETSDDHA